MVGSLAKNRTYRKYISDPIRRDFEFDFLRENEYHNSLLHDKRCEIVPLIIAAKGHIPLVNFEDICFKKGYYAGFNC